MYVLWTKNFFIYTLFIYLFIYLRPRSEQHKDSNLVSVMGRGSHAPNRSRCQEGMRHSAVTDKMCLCGMDANDYWGLWYISPPPSNLLIGLMVTVSCVFASPGTLSMHTQIHTKLFTGKWNFILWFWVFSQAHKENQCVWDRMQKMLEEWLEEVFLILMFGITLVLNEWILFKMSAKMIFHILGVHSKYK